MHNDIKVWYDGLANAWGGNYVSGNKHFIRRIRNVHLLADPLPEDADVLDIGCASGEIAVSMHARFKCRTIGIDISEEMVNSCRKKYQYKRLYFEIGDILNLGFRNGQFDLVSSLSVIEWVEDYAKAIAEVSRVLKRNGQWIVSVPNWASPFRRIELIKSLFSKKLPS